MNETVSQAAWISWSFPLWPSLGLLLAAALYLRGFSRIARTRPLIFAPWRAWCFLGGLLSLWLAIASPLDTMDGLLLTAHMTQHLILMSVVPPLILLGAPAVPFLRALPRSWVRDGLGPFLRAPGLLRVLRGLTHPGFAWLAMNLAYLGWHVPAAYDFALRYSAWHEVEHACFLGTSLLFWFPVIQPWPSKAHVSRWLMLPYLVGADLVNTALSAFLSFAGRVVYPSYLAQPRVFGLSALDDQADAGALMWVAGSIFFLVPLAAIALHLLSPKSQRVRPFAKVKVAAPSQPVPRAVPAQRVDLLRLPWIGSWIGALLRARYGRMVLQGVALVAAVAVIADGFAGPQMGAMNLAGILPWTFVRAFGVLLLLVLGNVFCMACPFTLPREIGRRLGLARFEWPQRLRSKWLAIALMVVFFWSYEAFDLWDHPMRTAWLLLVYFAAAFTVDTFFKGATFCKYVCPLGQFNFTASLLSPFTLAARSHAVCGSCTTRDCIAGNTQQRGCELQLYMPQKMGNMDCTLCMDCVKACPHDNIGLLTASPVRDLLQNPQRSSVGRLWSRWDIAGLIVLVVVSAFANAAAMVTTERWFAAGAAVVMAGVVMLAGVTAGKGLGAEDGHSLKEIFCSLAQALLPLGAAMWAAHLLFHLSTGWGSLSPAIHQLAADFGARFFPPAQWMSEMPLMAANHVLQLQLLLLDAGVLWTLYLGWRWALTWSKRGGYAVISLLPWVMTVAITYGYGVWILLEPMQMRGVMQS